MVVVMHWVRVVYLMLELPVDRWDLVLLRLISLHRALVVSLLFAPGGTTHVL